MATLQTFDTIPGKDQIKTESLRLTRSFLQTYPHNITEGSSIEIAREVYNFLSNAKDPLDYSRRHYAAQFSADEFSEKGDFAIFDFFLTMKSTYDFLSKE